MRLRLDSTLRGGAIFAVENHNVMSNYLKIGEFSQLMQTTVKTLRLYEQRGLLMPAKVDDFTGYRYYTVDQMQRLNSIRSLKNLGFSLDEIRDLFDDDNHVPDSDCVADKLSRTEAQITALIERRNLLQKWLDSRLKFDKMEKFTIEPLPKIIVASHRRVIENYDALGPLCYQVIGPEMQRLGCKCSQPGYCFTVEHATEYRPTDIDIEYCEQVEEALADSTLIKFKTLEAVPTALCVKHKGPYREFYRSYTEAFRFIEQQGYRIVEQPRASYIDGPWNQDDEANYLSIIQIPVEKI